MTPLRTCKVFFTFACARPAAIVPWSAMCRSRRRRYRSCWFTALSWMVPDGKASTTCCPRRVRSAGDSALNRHARRGYGGDQECDRLREASVVLVGHSYGGMVISGAGVNPKVKSVWCTSRRTRPKAASRWPSWHRWPRSQANPARRCSPARWPSAGRSRRNFLPRSRRRASIDTRFMAASQVPWAWLAVQAEVRDAAWKVEPTSYLSRRRIG